MNELIRANSERAEDLVEYALLLGFIALVAAAAAMATGASVTSIWTIMNSRYTTAGS